MWVHIAGIMLLPCRPWGAPTAHCEPLSQVAGHEMLRKAKLLGSLELASPRHWPLFLPRCCGVQKATVTQHSGFPHTFTRSLADGCRGPIVSCTPNARQHIVTMKPWDMVMAEEALKPL